MFVKKIFRKIIQKSSSNSVSEEFRFLRTIAGDTIFSILDVGANTGQSATQLHKLFPAAVIHSFEPVSETFLQLKRNMQTVTGSQCHCLALGNKSGATKIHLNRASEGNSLLPNSTNFRNYTDGWYGLEPKGTSQVAITTLDSWMEQTDISHVDFLKVDTQGADIDVLHGAAKALRERQIRFISVEAIFVPIYERQSTFGEITDLLSMHNFYLSGLFNQHRSPVGRLKWADAVFCRES
jgi:FkbM family methyltransferase